MPPIVNVVVDVQTGVVVGLLDDGPIPAGYAAVGVEVRLGKIPTRVSLLRLGRKA